MTEKIIIENRTDLPMRDVIAYVREAMHPDRISIDRGRPCYPLLTSWGHTDGSYIHVSARTNEKSDKFTVWTE